MLRPRQSPAKEWPASSRKARKSWTKEKNKDDAPADLGLIGAGLRVEHYEIAAYTTARNLALQLHEPAIVELLSMSLGEEQNAAQLLDQVAQPLMSVARMPASVE